MEQKKKKKKERVLMPWWINILLTLAGKVFLFFKTGFKCNRKALKNHQNGFILVYNHYSNQDHFVIKAALNFRRVSYVIASCFLYSQPLGTCLKLCRAISKEQFKPDLVAIRKMKKVIDQKGIVAIAPTGQTTVDGNPSYMPSSIVKLVRLAKADVVALRTRGIYLAFPKWRMSKRRCKANAEFITICKKEDLPNLTDEEILRRIEETLYVSEYTDQLTLKRKIKCKTPTAGLENIFIRCPKCGKRHSYKTYKNMCECMECGNTVVMDQYGLLHQNSETDVTFKTVGEWYTWQKAMLGEEIENGLVLEEEVIAISNKLDQNKLEECGHGVVYLSKDEFYYKGNIRGVERKLEFKLNLISQLPFDPGRRFEIPNEELFLRIVPKDIKKVMDYVQFIDYLNDERLR